MGPISTLMLDCAEQSREALAPYEELRKGGVTERNRDQWRVCKGILLINNYCKRNIVFIKYNYQICELFL